MTRFSIIIPAYNAAATIAGSVLSALRQEGIDGALDVIVVDDCSTDDTVEILGRLAAEDPRLVVAGTQTNSGPGAARNIGLDHATGTWVLFLDSDDYLAPSALAALAAHLDGAGDTVEAVGFDWSMTESGRPLVSERRRRDHYALTLPRSERVRRYLRLHLDGSVIFTAIRRDLITHHKLRFADGYHEDVDFIFMVYWHAAEIGYLDEVIYLKTQRPGSIINTISVGHLEGFLRAWKAIAIFLAEAAPEQWSELRRDWQRGLTGVVATRLREIVRRSETPGPLFDALHRSLADMPVPPTWRFAKPITQYEQLASRFIQAFGQGDVDIPAFTRSVQETMRKTWSCTDLHNSVFLAPNEARTCCKRFFVNGEMRGDVVLDTKGDSISLETITAAKRDLFTKINQGERTACDGCPFMEFKDWGALDKLNVGYLSLEYHSVCNLKCTYCSETYYGGAKASYDVEGLLDTFLDAGALKGCHTVVWGGGEPVVDKSFTPIMTKLVDQLPGATIRVLTNSVKPSATVEKLLPSGQVAVTTSIDAGSRDMFTQVRGSDRLKKVFTTLKRYAAAAPDKVTIKYIFTAENHAIQEVRGYVDLVSQYDLTGCNFQISSNFKEESVSSSVAISMIAMHGLLTRIGAEVIFLDDLLRHRLSDLLASHGSEIRSALAALGMEDVLADPTQYPAVTIWGAGWQARYLMEQTTFFQRVPVDSFVDQTPGKIGTRYFDRPVESPEALKAHNLPVVLAAAQGLPIIYRNYLAMGLDANRLVRQLIL